jgi:hypothetical protein
MPISRYAVLMVLCGTTVFVAALACITGQEIQVAKNSVLGAEISFVLALVTMFFCARASGWAFLTSFLLPIGLVLGALRHGANGQMPSAYQLFLIIGSIAIPAYLGFQREYLREPFE